MINLLLGAPGGGKSYEAVVFHILVALEKGRKVITNLPLVVEKIAMLDPAYAALIELRTESKAVGTTGKGDEARPWRVFEHEDDFGDPWRRSDGVGPLYVIDECHLAFPKGTTRRAVEEWFSLHRHENADVLLITQSYGKLSAAIRDLVQIVYRVRKNVAFGSMGSYTRKVQDGLRGEVVNTSVRKYERRYFGLYRSHTKGRSADELGASDVRPIWQHWSFLLAAACLVLVVGSVATGKVQTPWGIAKAKAESVAVKTEKPAPVAHVAALASSAVAAAASAVEKSENDREPYAGRGLHLTGMMTFHGRTIWTFVMSQNGQPQAAITDAELVAAGYAWKGDSQCSGTLTFGAVRRTVLCDAPQVGPGIPGKPVAG